MNVAAFVEGQLSAAPARVIESGCGEVHLARAGARLGYGEREERDAEPIRATAFYYLGEA